MFTHDCTKCKFIATKEVDGTLFDWYVCGTTILGRYGNEGSQYWSSLKSIVIDPNHFYGPPENRDNMVKTAREMLSR